MALEQEQLQAGIAALEIQRALLGDAVVDAAQAGLRARLAALAAQAVSPAPAQSAEPEQQLRQVSILFLDVVDSTAFSHGLDPEAINEVMDDALARGAALVQAHKGRVLQYAGDSILAAFGADGAREDDAERAVRCGLALLELGRKLGAEVLAAHRHTGFNVRVGIHTGGVLLGGGVNAQGSIRGIAVNIAARMEQAAPSGGLRISHDCYAQVRGLFSVQELAPLQVKGVDEAVQSYLVLRAKPRAFRIGNRGIEGVITQMIGREAELAQLQAAFKRLFSERKLAACTVVADAGLGKSRLLHQFEAWSEVQTEAVYFFCGRAYPHTEGRPYGLLRDILAWRFQIQDDDSLADARAKFEAGIMPLFLDSDGPERAEGHAHLLGYLIGIDYLDSRHVKGILGEPKQIRSRAFHAAAQLFRRIGARQGTPVLLQLEDLHWADNESLDFLAYLAKVNRDVALLIVAATRPTLFERRRGAASLENLSQRIDLQPLDKTASRLLAHELLKKLPEVPAALRELITGGAEGNPFYMEELVKMLIDQGAIQAGAESWSLNAERLLATQVPGTLTGVLQARLDGLPTPERLTMQQASVIGQVFWDRALEALDAQAMDNLPALVRRELTLPHSDAEARVRLEGLREYGFKHAMLHQVTYGTVLKRARRDLHGKLARWLAQQSGLWARDSFGLTAEHFEAAGELASAAEFHARAAEHGATRLAHERVSRHIERALALLDSPNLASQPQHQVNLRWRLLAVREDSLEVQGRRKEQRAALDALEQLAETWDSDAWRAHVAHRRASLAMRTADWPLQASSARHGAQLAESIGDDELRLRCLRLLATSLAHQGERRAGLQLAQDALAQAQALGLPAVQAQLLNTLAVIAGDAQGDRLAALAFNQQYLAIMSELGNLRSEAIGLSNVGECYIQLGALTQAGEMLDKALPMARANGDPALECNALVNLARLAFWQGDAVQSLTLARAAQQLARDVEAAEWETLALLRLGEGEQALGRLAQSVEAFSQAHSLALSIDDSLQHEASAGLARLALAQGDAAGALQLLEVLFLQHANGASYEHVEQPRLLELSCYRVLLAVNDPRADDWLARAHSALQAGAQAIADPALREGFLANVPYHGEILAAWAAR